MKSTPRYFCTASCHGESGPARSQVHILAHPAHLVGPQNLLGRTRKQGFKEIHHIVEIGVGLIQPTVVNSGLCLGSMPSFRKIRPIS